ncbi:hypothetical protein HK102_006546, partial [Quaeritorhiza haematococci]
MKLVLSHLLPDFCIAYGESKVRTFEREHLVILKRPFIPWNETKFIPPKNWENTAPTRGGTYPSTTTSTSTTRSAGVSGTGTGSGGNGASLDTASTGYGTARSRMEAYRRVAQDHKRKLGLSLSLYWIAHYLDQMTPITDRACVLLAGALESFLFAIQKRLIWVSHTERGMG